MKVALVIERFDVRGGGAERSTAQIAQELVTRGHQVTILAREGSAAPPALAPGVTRSPGTGPPGRWRDAPREAELVEPSPETLPGVEVRTPESPPRGSAAALWAFADWVAEQYRGGAFDVTLSVTTIAPAMVMQPRSGTLRETFERNVAMRSSAVGRGFKRLLLASSRKHRALLALEQQTAGHASVRRWVALSRYVREQLQRHYRIDPARIEVIPNAAAMPAVPREDRRMIRRRIREAFGIEDDQTAFLFAALNPRLKGFHPLMQALRLLKDQAQPAVVILAGGIGYAEQHTAAAMGVRDRVRMVGPTNRMADLYCAADVTVHPTFYDPSSKVVIESLMMGTPAISTSFNGASDFIAPEGGAPRGRVVGDPADAPALAQAMREMMDRNERDRCIEAMAGLMEELSMRLHVERLERVLIKAADRR